MFSWEFFLGDGEKVGAYSIKYGNKRFEDKNKLNEIILKGFFLKVKGEFPFPDFQKRGHSHPTTPLPLAMSLLG